VKLLLDACVDKDFGEIAILQGIPHSGILRLVDIAASSQGAVCEKVISTYISELVPGSIITVEPGRIRIRPPDDKLS
jgi:predicted nuclease of predicted toxin-antitoxin system